MISILCNYFLGGISAGSVLIDVLIAMVPLFGSRDKICSVKKASEDRWTIYKF